MFPLDTWSQVLENAGLIHFLDLNTSLGALINGCSSTEATTRLVHGYWSRLNRLKCFAWLDQVESKSNISDGPTRFDEKLLQEMGAVEVPAVVSGLTQCTSVL